MMRRDGKKVGGDNVVVTVTRICEKCGKEKAFKINDDAYILLEWLGMPHARWCDECREKYPALKMPMLRPMGIRREE